MSDERLELARRAKGEASRRVSMVLFGIGLGLALVVGIGWGLSSLRSGQAASVPVANRDASLGSSTESASAPSAETSSSTSDSSSEMVDTVSTGNWILVLESKEKSRYSLADVRSMANEMGSSGLLVIDSSETPGLNGGYWAIVYGSFSSEETARDSCGDVGRSAGDGCYPRYVG